MQFQDPLTHDHVKAWITEGSTDNSDKTTKDHEAEASQGGGGHCQIHVSSGDFIFVHLELTKFRNSLAK